jgi:Endoribonuclease XendoU
VNYLGHWNKVDLNRKGTGLSFTFLWGKEQKPFASFLVGTSPEFEMAIYTTCLLARNEDR